MLPFYRGSFFVLVYLKISLLWQKITYSSTYLTNFYYICIAEWQFLGEIGNEGHQSREHFAQS